MKKTAYPLTCEVDEDGREWWFDSNGVPKCGSLLRKWQERGISPPYNRCGKPPLEGRNRCRLHNGNAKRDIAHPNFKTGEHAYRFKHTNLAEAFAKFANDPDILDISSEITLTRARIQDLLVTDEINLQTIWEDMEKAFTKVQDGYNAMSDNRVREGLAAMDRLFEKVNNEFSRWDELTRQQDLLRKQVATEFSRRVRMQEMVRADDFMGFAVRVGLAMQGAKSIDEARRAIRRIIDQTLGR